VPPGATALDERRLLLTDDAWAKIAAVLAPLTSRRGAPPKHSDRVFVEAVMSLARTGVPWRDPPPRFGKWRAVYQRFRRWIGGRRGDRAVKMNSGGALSDSTPCRRPPRPGAGRRPCAATAASRSPG
jgi:hypothetical protein